MFNKKLKEQLFKAQQSSDYWERKFHEIENELDTQRGLRRYYRQEFQQFQKEIEQNKQSVENYTINLDISSIDMYELTRNIIEKINEGRY